MEIVGTGVDIIEVNRLEKAVGRWGQHFLDHIFCPEEIEYAKTKKFPHQHLAGRFAAKEAILKAVGDNGHLGWKDMKILNDQFGRPYCVMKPKFKTAKQQIHLSISHTENYAVANAIIAQST